MTRATLVAAVAAMLAPWAVAAVLAGRRRGPARARRSRSWLEMLARVGRRVGVPTAPKDLAARIAAAGLAGRLRVADAMAIKVGAAALGLLAAIGPAAVSPGATGRLLLLVCPATGFMAFDAWLRRRIRRRARQLGDELPDALELLRVAVEAGLSPWRALEEVGRRHRGLVGAELRTTTTRIALGASRDETLRGLVARCPLPAVGALAAALGRADRHGSPLSPALAALALDVRAERARAVRERAARAAPKIQLAIALLLVPGVLLLVGAALQATSAR